MMADLPAPPERPRAPPPKGWRWQRRRKERTLNDDFPTFGAKLRFFAVTAASLLLLGLCLLSLFAVQFTGLFTDDPAGELGYMVLLIGAAFVFGFAAAAISPFGEPLRKAARQKKAQKSERSGPSDNDANQAPR